MKAVARVWPRARPGLPPPHAFRSVGMGQCGRHRWSSIDKRQSQPDRAKLDSTLRSAIGPLVESSAQFGGRQQENHRPFQCTQDPLLLVPASHDHAVRSSRSYEPAVACLLGFEPMLDNPRCWRRAKAIVVRLQARFTVFLMTSSASCVVSTPALNWPLSSPLFY
jgi:hypothetical protein